MKSYINLCEDYDRYEFLIEGFPGVYGHLIEATEVDLDKRTVRLLGASFDARRATLEETLQAEREKGTFQLIVDFERSAAGLLGAVTYGVQLIVYRDEPDGLFLWLARRAPHKTLYPNRLGVTVGGSLPAGETPFECMIRESHEEAGLEADLIKQHAKAAGTISYVTTSETKTTSGGETGLIRAEIQYIYHLKVGPDVIPKPYDMEALDIRLYSIAETKKTLDDGEFTPANACLVLDFFIRHGLVTYENEDNYNRIITRLHRSLGIHNT
ncbi:NUDIX hydrolase domain-like protein [Lasiosphaeris hirsuta]|uniref:NUDIX hydrolase domain-like protein n=1 Tax=Lasiosphaeris hirsuta TaxID=260670 RepID=A0AA40DH83_9PEZI|nr:NUDIX hydrolase domain-like protein [Lasiosphaeris hirsuta]